MNRRTRVFTTLAAAALLLGGAAHTASHREAPLTAIDRTADITDFYAFVSPDDPETVTLILAVDPLLEPGNGPNYFPFDSNLRYAINVDNDQDGVEDVRFEFRFRTEQRLPGVPVGFAGAGSGVLAPANSPAPVAPGTPIIPPAITALDGPGSEGLGLRQTYDVTMVRYGAVSGAGFANRQRRRPLANDATAEPGKSRQTRFSDSDSDSDSDSSDDRRVTRTVLGRDLIALPSNVGPRTMPEYDALFEQGIHELGQGFKVFAGTTDDAFYIDLGATFDSLNFRLIPGPTSTGIPAVLSDEQDASTGRLVPDDVAGYNVNTIAIQVPIEALTRFGNRPESDDPFATIGTWGVTERRRIELRRPEREVRGSGAWVQVQRMANPLFNELLIGTDLKNLWSRSKPSDDAQFASFALDPVIARIAQAAYGGAFDIPTPPRTDLLPLVTYAAPIAAAGTDPGPIADLLRVNVGVAPTPFAEASRLGLLGGDGAGFPNGRRPVDDVTDIVLRVGVGGVLAGAEFNVFPNNRLGDGVNGNDMPIRETFPFVAPAHDGRDSRHIDPGESLGG